MIIKSREEKEKELEDNILLLEEEMDEVGIISENRRQILEQYSLYKKCFNKRIFVSDVNNSNIRINNNSIGLLEKGILTSLYEGVKIDSSIHFVGCNNTTVLIYTKVNHITLESCKNLDVKIVGGAVTGIDNINCVNTNYIFDDNDIYFIDISGSYTCNMYVSERVAKNTLIITMHSLFVNVVILDSNNNMIRAFKKNMNYLDTLGNYKYNLNSKKLENV